MNFGGRRDFVLGGYCKSQVSFSAREREGEAISKNGTNVRVLSL
jgi:hypothetical protein